MHSSQFCCEAARGVSIEKGSMLEPIFSQFVIVKIKLEFNLRTKKYLFIYHESWPTRLKLVVVDVGPDFLFNLRRDQINLD